MPTITTSGPRAERQRQVFGRLTTFCGTCGHALQPAPAGGDEAVLHGPRYCGFLPCCPRGGDLTNGSRHEPLRYHIT